MRNSPDRILTHFNFPFSDIPVVVIREEGINGDREMAAALHMAGFEVWDCTMQDLLDHKITIDRFRGVVFPGGFSYAGTQTRHSKIDALNIRKKKHNSLCFRRFRSRKRLGSCFTW